MIKLLYIPEGIYISTLIVEFKHIYPAHPQKNKFTPPKYFFIWEEKKKSKVIGILNSIHKDCISQDPNKQVLKVMLVVSSDKRIEMIPSKFRVDFFEPFSM